MKCAIFSLMPLMALLFGCATGPKTELVYVQVFDAGVSYEKAIAQCQYEEHLQSRADERSNKGSGGGLASLLFSGRPDGTQVYCMKRFGWELQKRELKPTS